MDAWCAKDALRAVLHTVLLSRALGRVTPRELRLQSFPALGVASCGNAAVEQSVENALERFFAGGLQLVGPDLVRGELMVSFYESRRRAGLFGSAEERVYWERWLVPVIVNQSASSRESGGEAVLRASLMRVVLLASDVGHVPRPPDGNATFKYELSVSQQHNKVSGQPGVAATLLNQMLQSGPPMRFNL